MANYAFLLILGADFSLQSALQMRKCIVESCSGYLKHSSDSGEYVSKKIMVIRCVELNIKQENDILSQNWPFWGLNKKVACIGL